MENTDNWQALFDLSRRFTLAITGSPLRPDVLHIKGREALSEPFRWTIDFTVPPGDIAPEQLLLKYASLKMRSGRTAHGRLTALERLSVSADQWCWRVTLEPRLALLSHTRGCAVFQNLSVPELVEQLLRRHGLRGPDFEFRLSRTYPDRELITQWHETDLAFIQRILAEVGIWFRFEMNDLTELEVLIFGDGQRQYLFDVRLPYREPSGLYDGAAESVWDVRTWDEVVTSRVAARDHNYRSAGTPMDASAAVRSDAVTTGERYGYGEPYREAGDDDDPEPATESGAFYARIRHERLLNKASRVHLFSNAAHLTPGQVLEPQGGVIKPLRDGVLLTLVTFWAARDTRLHVSLWGQPYSERYCFRPACPERPEIFGTLPARVESRDKGDIYAHLDEHGRYRVRLDFDRSGSERGWGYLWLRRASPFAGAEYGWHTPLTDGTEVAIAFSRGDPDLPFIAHALHDAQHPDPVTRDNHTRNVLRTPANNKLRMEDRRGQEHIKLATEYGKTQLNAGHIVDAQGKPRGGGTELRTDEYGVIRAGKGLYLGADLPAGNGGEAPDREAALREIAQLEQELAALQAAAAEGGAIRADVDAHIAMFNERLKPLNEVLHLHAPEGVALASGEDMQLAAAENLSVHAGGEVSIGAMGNMTAMAGESLGLFARTGPLSLKSGEGPVKIQAQHADLRLLAGQEITLSSTANMLFAGKKRITLIGGGSYLRIEEGRVEYGTAETYLRRVKRTFNGKAASVPFQAAAGGGLCLSCLMTAAMRGDAMVIRGQS